MNVIAFANFGTTFVVATSPFLGRGFLSRYCRAVFNSRITQSLTSAAFRRVYVKQQLKTFCIFVLWT